MNSSFLIRIGMKAVSNALARSWNMLITFLLRSVLETMRSTKPVIAVSVDLAAWIPNLFWVVMTACSTFV